MNRTKAALKVETIKASKYLVAHIQNLAPRHIAPHVIAKTSYSGDTTSRITVHVKKVKPNSDGRFGTADAAAQEYGSGLQDPRGGHYIKIPKKKGKKLLAFFWDKADPKIPRLPDGRVLLKSVNHPGISPYNGVGYMREGFKQWKSSEQGYKGIARGYKQAIAADVKDSMSALIKRFGKK